MDGLLKFITCGSVDDGKSTLIGHILYDSKLLYADQKEALILDSKVGSRGGAIDYSLLLDGLMAEREQGITIDVAYRYFTTDHRSFIVADTPGHEEYTRNMAVGASFAQLAIILVDAKQGVLKQTRRHSRICKLMGIRHFVFTINKMDLVDYSQPRYDAIAQEITLLARELDLQHIMLIPVSATEGDNVTTKSPHTPWYEGPPLLSYLEQVKVKEEEHAEGFYLPVQRVCRPSHEFRGFQGQVESGELTIGQEIITLPSKETAVVKSLLNGDQQVDKVFTGQAVTIELDREVDVSRGCVLTDQQGIPLSKAVKTTILWMDDEALVEGKEYLAKIGTKMIPARIKNIFYKIDVNTGEQIAADIIVKNEIFSCALSFTEKIPVDLFERHKTLGELILIDRISHMTSACGIVEEIIQEQKTPYFEHGDLKAQGCIFEEFYFNLENAYLAREKSEIRTYHVGDSVPIQGETYQYPSDFVIIALEDGIAIQIRDGVIEQMRSLSAFPYVKTSYVDERGFALKIYGEEEFDEFLQDYKASEAQNAKLHNRWAQFETYRRIVFNNNFWII